MHKVDIERLLLKGFDSVGELVRANQFKCFRPRLSINLRSSELFAPTLQCAAFSLSLIYLLVMLVELQWGCIMRWFKKLVQSENFKESLQGWGWVDRKGEDLLKIVLPLK